MDRIVSLIIGLLCGIGQFYVVRATLKPLSEGKDLQMFKVVLLKLPIPVILFLGCAFINIKLLPFVGIAFCLSLTSSGIINHLMTMKKKG